MKLLNSHASGCFKIKDPERIIVLSVLLLLPLVLSAQFEKKISINISPGIFKTIGPKDYPDPYEYDYKIPYLMPNFTTGWTVEGGVQFNYSRKISFGANLGIARSGYWYYDAYDPDYDDYYCWLCWEIYDENTYELVASGEDYLTLFNFNFGIYPKLYFLPSKRINPYTLLEINLNYTSVNYIDAMYEKYVSLGREDEYGESLSETWMEKSFGIGLYPGIGTEINLSDNIGIFLQTGYWLIILNKDEFELPEDEENFHALRFQLGVRMSFWKSKKL